MSGSRPARESVRGDIAAGVSLQKKKKLLLSWRLVNNFFSLCTSLQAHRRLLFSLPSFTVSFPFFLYSITMQSRSIVIKSLSHLVRVSGRFSYLQESQTRRKRRLLVSDWEEEQLRRNISLSLSLSPIHTHSSLPLLYLTYPHTHTAQQILLFHQIT